MDNWYIYEHYKADTNEIFYIGIGCQKNFTRAHSKKSRSSFWHNIVKKHGIKVVISKENLSKEEASKLEKELIKNFGRKDLDNGILCNLTDGGDGVCGLTSEGRKKIGEAGKKRKHNLETIRKISEAAKGRFHTEESKKLMSQNRKGKKISEEGLRKLSEALKGRKLSEETKKRMSISRMGRKFSEETKQKISISKKGNKYFLKISRPQPFSLES